MRQISIRLYQPDDVLEGRLPGGVAALSAYIRTLGDALPGEAFEDPPPEDRATVIAVAPGGVSRGWAIDREGRTIRPEQDDLERALASLETPAVVVGPIVFAIHYAAGPSEGEWLPLPREWSDVAEALGGSAPVDVLVGRLLGED